MTKSLMSSCSSANAHSLPCGPRVAEEKVRGWNPGTFHPHPLYRPPLPHKPPPLYHSYPNSAVVPACAPSSLPPPPSSPPPPVYYPTPSDLNLDKAGVGEGGGGLWFGTGGVGEGSEGARIWTHPVTSVTEEVWVAPPSDV